MGKRVIRILAGAIAEKLPEVLNVEVNVILKSGVTLHGFVIGYDAVSFQFKDLILRKHLIQLADIEELVIDKVSRY